MAAAQAKAEMDPPPAGGEAILAAGQRMGPDIRLDLAHVGAAGGHRQSLTRQRRLG